MTTPTTSSARTANPATGGERARAGTNYHTQALARGLAVLEAVAAHPGPATLGGLHELTGLAKSTLVRLLAAMTDLGYVVRADERPSYRLGHKIGALSAAYLDDLDIEELVAPMLADLAEQTRQTTNLAVLDGTDIVHLAVCHPDRLLRYDVTVGERSGARVTGLGKAILAHLDPAEVSEHVDPEPWESPSGSHVITSLEALTAELARSRKRGYAVDDNEFAEGLFCVAVPVLVEDRPVAALSLSGASGEFTKTRQGEFVELLRSATDRLAADPAFLDALDRLPRYRRRTSSTAPE